jgi:CheY-like chemotaxis protein
MLRTIRSSGEALLAVINDVLDFSRIEAGKLQIERSAFDLRAMVEDALSVVAPQARAKNLGLHLKWNDAVPAYVESDACRVRQVLLNLLSNAVKFTEEGSVTLEVNPASPGSVRFSVRDTGIGIAPDVMARLFQPFSQGDASTTRLHGGTGLGLAISQRLVTALGGSIEADSRPGRGSCFEFAIPLPLASGAGAGEREGPPDNPLSGHVLVVDDGAVNQTVARRLLDKLGCTSDAACSGSEALVLAGSRTYDAILMDCVMPGMDGYETTRVLRSRASTRRTPIIGLSANALAEDRTRALSSGMDDYLTKPVNLDQLRRTLSRRLQPVADS